MAGSDKTVKVRLVADASPYAKGMTEASVATKKLGKDIDDVESKNKGFAKSTGQTASALKGMAIGGAAVAGTALVAFLGDAVSAAGDLEQSIGGVDAVFKESAGTIHDFGANSAEAVGLSENAFNELITVTGAMLKNKGLEDFAQKSIDLVKIGADLSATFGGTAKEAVEALNAAMRGESDPIERYGISLNETAVNAELASKGLTGLTGAALDQAKAQARIDIITRQSSDALGAFAREADTLQGQQQRLNAEWEDAKASLGGALLPALTSATEVMRSGVDTALAAAEAFGELPGPIKAAAGALIALHILKGPLGGFLASTISQVKTLSTTLRGGGIAASAKAAGSALMGAFGGPLGLAVGAGAAALTFWASEAAKTDAIAQQLKDTIDQTSGAFSSQSQTTVEEALFGDLSTEDIKRLQELGVNFNALAAAALKGGPALQSAQDGLDGLKDFDLLFMKDDADIIDGLKASLDRAGQGAERSKILFGELKPSADDAARGLGGAAEAAGGLGDAIFKAADFVDDVEVASIKAADALDTMAISESAAEEAAAALRDAHKELADAILAVTDAAVDADEAQSNYEQSLDDARKAVEENGKTVNKARTEINLSTEAGRKNAEALRGLRDDALKAAEANLTNGDSVQSVKDKLIGAREEFIKVAQKMGLSKQAAREMADEYGLTKDKVDALRTSIELTPAQKKVAIEVATQSAKTAIKGVDALLTALANRRIVVPVVASVSQVAASVNNVGKLFGWKKAATGGLIRGPGTTTSDSIPTLLSDKEYVVKAAAVKKYGLNFMQDVNAMRFAQGGFVSRMSPRLTAGPTAQAESAPTVTYNAYGLDVDAALAKVERDREWNQRVSR